PLGPPPRRLVERRLEDARRWRCCPSRLLSGRRRRRAARNRRAAERGAAHGWQAAAACERWKPWPASAPPGRPGAGPCVSWDSVALFDVSDSSVVPAGNGIGEVKDAVVV